MKEIKFKLVYQSKDTDEPNKIFLSKPILIEDLLDRSGQVDFTDGGYLMLKELNPNCCKWLQYTGLNDRNGKEIYEGDILLESAPRGYRGQVIFNDGGFIISERAITLEQHNISYYEFEIIGNIYETLELLK